MGKHSKRKAGYLPKVAAGAAPFALLLAAPASAWAGEPTQPLNAIPLPLDHQHDGTFGRDLQLSNEGDASVIRGFLSSSDHDVYSRQLGDTKVVTDARRSLSDSFEGRDALVLDPSGALSSTTAAKDTQAATQALKHTVSLGDPVTVVTDNEQHVDKYGGRSTTLAAAPLGGTTRAGSQDSRRVSTSDRGHHGVWLPQGIDAVSENNEQAGGGLVRSAGLDATPGDGRFAGNLVSDLGGRRSSGQAIDVGDTAALGMTSEQHALGRFSGTLGLTGPATAGLAAADLGQAHAFGGHAGPVSGLVNTGQSARLGQLVTGAPESRTGDELADSFSGDLGVDHVLRVQGSTKTSALSVGGLPAEPAAVVSHDHAASVGVLDQAPTTTGLHVGAPPLSIQPR